MARKPLTHSRRYKSFVRERDKALERLLNHCLTDQSRILNDGLNRCLDIVAHRYIAIPEHEFFTTSARAALNMIDHQLDAVMGDVTTKIYQRQVAMKRHVALLTLASENEAISRVTGEPLPIHISRHKLDSVSFDRNAKGENTLKRISLTLSRIKRAIMDAVETSRVMEEGVHDMLNRVKASLPPTKSYVKPPRKLAIQESDKVDLRKNQLSVSFVDDDEWNQMLEDYKEEYLPETRFINEPIDKGDGVVTYEWQEEQNAIHEFMTQVTEGKVDAAKESGIKEFVWIAVLDDKTDDCCEWRDGLTTAEIRDELNGGHKSDECDTDTPPAHFNCRCYLAPVGDVPDKEEVDYGEFSDWLDK